MINRYVIDLRVYSTVPRFDIEHAWQWPDSMFTHGNLPPGIHQLEFEATESYLDELSDWIYNHPDLKIIGVHINNPV